jgi:hypothetical protein
LEQSDKLKPIECLIGVGNIICPSCFGRQRHRLPAVPAQICVGRATGKARAAERDAQAKGDIRIQNSQD